MAHEIDMTTGIPAIAYVGDEPWHGLGQKMDANADIATWTKAAGLDWTAQRATVLFDDGDELQAMLKRDVIYRSDTKAPLSVVSKSYQEVQPSDIMGTFDKIIAANKATMETAGALCDGKIIWALARMGSNSEIADDLIAPFLLMSTSYDMTTPTVAKLVATRVVCSNTISMAFGEKDRTQVRIPHKIKFDADQVLAGMSISLDAFDKFKQQALALTAKSFSQSDMDRYLIKLLQPEKGEIAGDTIRKSKTYLSILDLFNGEQLGGDQDAVKATAWGAVNAVTQFIDHAVGKNQNTRLKSAWFGQGSLLKQRAFELLAA